MKISELESCDRSSAAPNKALKSIRRAVNMRQSDFAELVRFSLSQIASVESGRRIATPEFSWQIAAVTGADANSIQRGAEKPLDWRGQPYTSKSYEDFKKRPSIQLTDDSLEQILYPLKTVIQAAAQAGCLKECTAKIRKDFEFMVIILPGLQAAVSKKLRPMLGAKPQLTVADMKRDPELAEKLGISKDADILRCNEEEAVLFTLTMDPLQELWRSRWYQEGEGKTAPVNPFGSGESSWC